tara:strand:+ start:4445 stop:5812 length:1368 start_codon:yes stop_codon:yes gene_type:complete
MSRARSLSLIANESAVTVINDTLNVGIGQSVPGNSKLAIGAGVTVDGVSGVITATSFVGDGASLRNVSATNTVGGATSVKFNDSVGAYWGATEDLEIIHDGSDSYIRDKGTGDLNISGSIVRAQSSGGETLFRGVENGAVELYFDNSNKIETTNTGAVVTGILTATTNFKGDLVGNVTGDITGNISGAAATFTGSVTVGGTLTHEDVTQVDSVGIVTAGLGVRVLTGGVQAVGFYTGLSAAGVGTFNGDVQFKGASTNATWRQSASAMRFDDDTQLNFGTGDDADIYHDGGQWIFNNATGNFKLRSTSIHLAGTSNEKIVVGNLGVGVTLYYNDSAKLETTNAGVVVTGVCTAQVPSAPQNSQSGSYTLVKSDAGKHIYNTSTTECPANVFAAGDMITIYNNSGSTQNVNQGSGLTMYLSDGEGNSGNRDLKQRCVCTVLYTSTTEAVISGGGLE